MSPTIRPALSPLLVATGAARERALARAPQAEWGLAHQGAQVLLTRDQAAGWLVRRAGRRLVALGLPLESATLADLARAAAVQDLAPLLYKCDGATAAAARREGWSVLRLGHEAVLDLDGWTLDRPACRQLRRKLRSAAVQRLRIEEAVELPLARMTVLSREWEARRGGERGFSMGRLDRRLLERQRVLLAWDGDRLVAFASFHVSREEWTLDLVRHGSASPAGAIHRIVADAARRARTEGAARLSLAGLPELALPGGAKLRGEAGLRQFKLAFGPRLSPRYAAAPGRIALLSGLLRVAMAIRWPGPLPGRGLEPETRRGSRAPHFAFEPAPVPCDARSARGPWAARPIHPNRASATRGSDP